MSIIFIWVVFCFLLIITGATKVLFSMIGFLFSNILYLFGGLVILYAITKGL